MRLQYTVLLKQQMWELKLLFSDCFYNHLILFSKSLAEGQHLLLPLVLRLSCLLYSEVNTLFNNSMHQLRLNLFANMCFYV